LKECLVEAPMLKVPVQAWRRNVGDNASRSTRTQRPE
jgi:hypothetical protein